MEYNCSEIVQAQKNFYQTRQTHDISYRKKALKKLLKEVKAREEDICDALYADFKKPKFESVITETGIVISELKLAIKKLKSWSKPKRVWPALLNFPSKDRIHSEPYGTTLIIAPWNYPYQLAIAPLIGAVAAGNTVVVKPSELTPNTSQIVEEIISAVFDDRHVKVVQGGVPASEALLAERWDYIFFTGSVNVGKIVAKAAAPNLTPVTLELGGKNPCIVDIHTDFKLTAKRIVWGKFLNAGQTCIAPDYLIVQAQAKFDFIKALVDEIETAYGNNPQESPDYPRIINEKNFERLAELLEGEKVLYGGKVDKDELYIAPTLLDEPSLDSNVMQDEIFGPILPIQVYSSLDDISNMIANYEKPLSLYVFSNDKKFANRMIARHSFGGGAINDTVTHFVNHRMPFGGVGHSGIGAYHGKHSFDTFSHKKSITNKKTWLDIPMRYAPYKGKLKLLKFFLKYF
ncbi:aldehyde dehydrogenase (NAD+) [Kordia periserrulae]|uniref:Aldehyde dehydrogenase n=1 Tax=Kordia periserrulae TaxID=701523 RepID=A0A2T6BZB4_9FLAO|nr:aldehyde dehydrogenase [Kordia periserrulae]PTX61399.1 aldehyde dehydrogenase (NAD+) [Kordia periserrulae]